MINSFVESTVWKRTANFGAYSLLRSACCFIVVLGGMLVATESHAVIECHSGNEFHAKTCRTNVSLGDYVVVQNVKESGYDYRNVREQPDNTDPNNVLGSVKDGDKGIVTPDAHDQYVKQDSQYVWYHVRWDTLRKKGWIAGINSDFKYIATMIEVKQKDEIVKALFNGRNNRDKYITPDMTKHDYNDYGCNADWRDKDGNLIYSGGGHAGWDVKTRFENDESLRHATFYSLTSGTVVNVTDLNTIAIFDGRYTTVYLHANDVEQSVENRANSQPKGFVKKGEALGTQGKKGNAEGEHVHIEVRKNYRTLATYCDDDTTVDPIPYLYTWVTTRTEDVNRDGRVNHFDLLEVLRNWGKDNPQCDVNGDGNVDMSDCDAISAHWDDTLVPTHAAPILPERKTRLLTNYPNPFNPETWIPYQLGRSADVSVLIHAADGTEVRTLELGHRPAGLYLQKNRAAYWDGRNTFGEEVGSGIYFYTLSAGDFSSTHRMIIRR